MQQIIYFFQKFKYFLFFIVLEGIALFFIFNNLSFHKSKFINSANSITGGIYNTSSEISEYFNLKKENKLLAEENIKLKNLLAKKELINPEKTFIVIDSIKFYQKYTYSLAKIINNNYAYNFNYLTLDKGKNDNIDKEMAVINTKGIIGITDQTSKKYTRVQSILNKNSRINARLKNTNYFGSLVWNGKDYNTVQLLDFPRQTPIKIGDTIETGGKSTIFPEGILIGKVQEINTKNTTNSNINIKLFNDMRNLGHVYIIKNLDQLEIKKLEANYEE